MIVAYFIPHFEDIESGIITEPYTAQIVSDLYEGEHAIFATFQTEDGARDWLADEEARWNAVRSSQHRLWVDGQWREPVLLLPDEDERSAER